MVVRTLNNLKKNACKLYTKAPLFICIIIEFENMDACLKDNISSNTHIMKLNLTHSEGLRSITIGINLMNPEYDIDLNYPLAFICTWICILSWGQMIRIIHNKQPFVKLNYCYNSMETFASLQKS